MSPEIRVQCHTCHSVLGLPADRCELLLCLDRLSSPTLGFRCPACGPQLRPDLTLNQMLALVKAGVGVREYLSEKPTPEPARITHDDLLEFHEHLDDELAALLGGAA